MLRQLFLSFILILLLLGFPLIDDAALTENTHSTDLDSASSQYWEKSTTTGLWSGGGAFTIAAWFKTTGTTEMVIFSHGNQNNNNGVSMNVVFGNTNTDVGVRIEGGNKSWRNDSAINDGNWHLLVVTYPGGSVDIDNASAYLDGSAMTAQAYAAGTPNVTADSKVRVGANVESPAGAFFKGQIDDVRVWSRELSSTEVSDLYNDPCNFDNGTDFDGQWLFDNNGNDETANNNDLTAYNSAGFTTVHAYDCEAAVEAEVSNSFIQIID